MNGNKHNIISNVEKNGKNTTVDSIKNMISPRSKLQKSPSKKPRFVI